MAGVVEEIISRCQAGDRAAQRQLFEDTSARIYRLILRFTGSSDDAWDITQETFYKALTSIRQFDGRSAFTTWLHRIAVNEALQHRRRVKNRRRELDGLTVATPSGGEPDEKSGLRLDVQEALAALAPMDRVMLLLRYTEGLDYRTIAEITGSPLGTVASRLNRAREQLRRILQVAYGAGEENQGEGHPTYGRLRPVP